MSLNAFPVGKNLFRPLQTGCFSGTNRLSPITAAHRANPRPASTVNESEAAIPTLSRVEIEQVREWVDGYLEDQLELTGEVKSKLEQSRREIAVGQYRTRQPR